MTTKQELQNELSQLTSEQEKLRIEIEKLEKKWRALHDKKQGLSDKLTKVELEEPGDELKVLFKSESDLAYNKLKKIVESYGLYLEGVWNYTQQRSIKVAFHREDDNKNKKSIEGVKRLLPYVKPVESFGPDEDIYNQVIGGKPFDLFENTLGRWGIYHFYVMPNDEVILCFARYGWPEFTNIGSFDDAMKYLQVNHWLDSNEVHDCDDDDDDDDY